MSFFDEKYRDALKLCGSKSGRDERSDCFFAVYRVEGRISGFEQSEVDKIIANGGSPATLGKRILRAETAPLAALSRCV